MTDSFQDLLTQRLREALQKQGIEKGDSFFVTRASDSRFGDYQANAAMILAKQLHRPPRELANTLVEAIRVEDISDPPTIAGPGFLNFRISNAALQKHTETLLMDVRLGVPKVAHPLTIILDFSSPNVAKPMHVGHIRSTILGDTLARIARFMGHKVICDNHLGDWGTQFGKVIYGWKHFLDRKNLKTHPISELVRLYREVHSKEERGELDPQTGEPIANIVRKELVTLQNGEPENLAIWKEIVALSQKEFEKIYDRLDISFDFYLGESFYNEALAPLVDRFINEGIARESEGAICVFFEDDSHLADKPCIIRKRDGGFLYATTDLATLEYRVKEWNPDEIWYVTGAPQQLHFQQIFAIAKKTGTSPRLEHIAFGSILGEDRKMMKTRSGENVLLTGLLDEAVERARKIILEKNPHLSEEEKNRIAEAVGIGAMKYAELSQSRMTDYVFSWDKLLSFQGNTAPYLQNAYVRVRSIFRQLESLPDFSKISVFKYGNLWGRLQDLGSLPDFSKISVSLTEPQERVLALKIAQFAEEVPAVLDQYRPNTLALYLFELANAFHAFYEACPVLRAEEPTRSSRLALCELTARVLAVGLDLLGIRVLEKM